MLLAVLCGPLSGCAVMGGIRPPKATLNTNIPFFQRSGVTVYNSARPDIAAVPRSRGDAFVTEYEYGDRDPGCLWLCRKKTPIRILILYYGQSTTVPFWMNMDQNTVYIPFSLQILQKKGNEWGFIGFWNECYAVPPGRDVNFSLIFSKEKLEEMKEGRHGRECGSGYW